MVGWGGWGCPPTSLTAEGRAARLALEAATDASQSALVDGLGDGIEGVIAAAEAIAERVLVAGAFPSDPRKRAGG